MSGHSKWANIRIRKGAQDAKRGKIFTRHARLIEIAARAGGADPTSNNALRVAIENAKADSVPNANIERAVKKGSGELKGEAMQAVVYEAYAPGGAAVIIECLTDNKNRTIASVRSTIEKRGGKWAESGSVMFLFQRKGVVLAKGTIDDDTELALIDAGVEEIEKESEMISLITDPTSWNNVRDLLKEKGLEVEEAGLKYIAQQTVTIDDPDTAQKFLHFIEAIEEDDDVSEVHSNADVQG